MINKLILSNNFRLTTGLHLHRSICSSVSRFPCSQLSKQPVSQSDDNPADWNSAIPYENIPGPKPLPILGNSLIFLFGEYKGAAVTDFNESLFQKYGKIAVIRNVPGRADIVLVSDPADIEKIYRNEGQWPMRVIFPSLNDYFNKKIKKEWYDDAKGLLTMQGHDWYNMRSKVSPILMQSRIINSYTSGIDQVTTDFILIMKEIVDNNVRSELPANFKNHINYWTLESVAFVALNRRLGCLNVNQTSETKEIINIMERIFHALYVFDFHLSGAFYKRTKAWKIFNDDLDYLREMVCTYIDEARKTIEQKKAEGSTPEESILAKLLDVDEKLAVTMTLDSMTGAIDTTSSAAAIVLYSVARYKDVQKKLREEVNALIPHPDSPITTNMLDKANYLKAVIKESMRIFPIATGNVRTTLRNIVLGGYQIPKGVDVLTNNKVLSVNEAHYPRPLEFLPERWLRSTTDELSHRNTSPFVTLPFGYGPRSCVGQRLANLLLQILVAKVVRNFELEWHHKDMAFVQSLTIGCADPLLIKMRHVKE